MMVKQKRYLCKKKIYQNKLLGLIIFMIFLLGFFAVIYMDSYQLTLEEQRKETYGAWHFAVFHTEEEEEKLIENHATVKECGKVKIAGDVVNEDGNSLSSIGSADELFFSIGNITLLSGRMPQEDNEIAVEASFLTRLGYSYELGQIITLKILLYDEEDEESVQTCSFTLVGVVKNYSAYWKTEENQMLSFFSTSEFCEHLTEKGRLTSHLFAILKTDYIQEADALNILCKKGDFVKNDYVYMQYSNKDMSELNGLFLYGLILCVGCIAIILLIQSDLNHQRNNFITLRLLGAKKSQILQMYFRQKRKVIIFSSCLGMISGVLIPYLLFMIFRKSGSEQIWFQLSWRHIIQMAVVFSIGIVVSFSIGMTRLFQVPLRGKPQQQATIYHMPKRKKKLNEKNLFVVLNKINCKKRIMSVILIFVSAAFILLSSYQTWEAYQSYKKYCIDYPDDYSFGMLSTYFTPRETMTEEQINLLEKAYGVGEVKTIAVSDYCPLIFSGETNKSYLKTVKENLEKIVGTDNISDEYVSGSFIGISDNLYHDYANETDTELLCRGKLGKDEIILYLPDYVQTEEELEQVDLDFPTNRSGKKVKERKIKIGDTVNINTRKGNKTLTIVGIIYSFSNRTPVSLNPAKPFSMICSKETYQQIWEKYEPSYVIVNGENTAIPYQTDVELSKINTHLYFENNRVEREEQLNHLILNFIMTMILSISVFLLIIFIRFGIYFSSGKQEIERYRVFYQLGMEKNVILNHFIKNSIFESFFGVVSAIMVLFGYRCLDEAAILAGFSDKIGQNQLSFLMEICKRSIYYTHWDFVLVTVFVLISFNFLLSVICDYWNIYHEALLK